MTPFDWSRFLALARELSQPVGHAPPSEERARSAISRAYYAAFNLARELLEASGEVSLPTDDKVHRAVINAFANDERRSEWREIGKHLDRLRRRRNAADYDVQVGDIEGERTRAIFEASDIEKRVMRARSRKTP